MLELLQKPRLSHSLESKVVNMWSNLLLNMTVKSEDGREWKVVCVCVCMCLVTYGKVKDNKF